MVVSERLLVVPDRCFSTFSSLQSRPHEVWSRYLGSSLKDDLLYAPADCFETFPFPANSEGNAAVEATGQLCHEFLARN